MDMQPEDAAVSVIRELGCFFFLNKKQSFHFSAVCISQHDTAPLVPGYGGAGATEAYVQDQKGFKGRTLIQSATDRCFACPLLSDSEFEVSGADLKASSCGKNPAGKFSENSSGG